MAITATDIQEQGFEHSLRGYDIDQVDTFLERVAEEVDQLMTANDELTKQLAAAKAAEAAAEEELALLKEVKSDTSEDKNVTAPHEAVSVPVFDDHSAEINELKSRAMKSESELSDANRRLADCDRTIASLQKQLDEKSDMDSTISAAFISAQRSADALKEEARAEGERIYRESEAKAREFIREALIEKQHILNEIETLTKSCNKFREEYRTMLQHFITEADENFDNVKMPFIDDDAVNAVLPDIETVPVPAESSASDTVPAMKLAPANEKAESNAGSVGTVDIDDIDIDELD